jgi:hypothetical protein
VCVWGGEFYHCHEASEHGYYYSLCMHVNRNLEDFVTWVDTSAIRRHIMEYNEMVGSSLNAFNFILCIYAAK